MLDKGAVVELVVLVVLETGCAKEEGWGRGMMVQCSPLKDQVF